MQGRNSFVAFVEGKPAGFSDLNSQGDIDVMFVDPRHLRIGAARQLLCHAEAHARRSSGRANGQCQHNGPPFL